MLPETLTEVENMERLVEEILADLQNRDGWPGRKSRDRCRCQILLAKVTETLLPLAEKRQITVHSQIARGGSLVIRKCRLCWKRPFHNILSNAIRHSPGRAQKSFIQLTPSVLTVTNTGTSIPEEDLPVLFTPFYRVEKSRNKSTGGSGLGLYLVKTILELTWVPVSGGKHGIRSGFYSRNLT